MRYRIGLSGALVLTLAAGTAFAQTGQTAQIPLQFDFLNPGARSLGLGSAFTAVADDATAAFTNPAGLTLLARPEVSLELRFRQLDTPYLAGGRLSGTVTNSGIDTITGPRYENSRDIAFRPYFLSGALPVGRWTVALHRHELVRQDNEFETEGTFRAVPGTNNVRQLGLAGERRITVDNFGGGVAYRVSDQLSVGASVNAYRFKVDTSFGTLFFSNGLFSPVDVSTRGLGSTNGQTGSQTKFAFNAGVLVSPSRSVRVGAVYRQGASFEYEQVDSVPNVPVVRQIGVFRTPAAFAVGIRLAPTETFAIAADYQRVQYSRLAQDFITFQVPADARSRVSVDDGNELHVGAEYTVVRRTIAPSFRVGLWYDPSHAVQYRATAASDDQDLLLSAIFPGGDDLWHFTFGVGLPLGLDYELNAGVDLTSERRYVSVSMVARFGR